MQYKKKFSLYNLRFNNIKSFIPNSLKLFNDFLQNIAWDESMKARLTASFGVTYNYSQILYDFKKRAGEI